MTITFKGGIVAAGQIKVSVNSAPIWTTPAGSIGTVAELSVVSFQFEVNDPEGGNLTYTLISGSVPAGLNLSSSGLLSGTADSVEVDTTSNFTIRVTDSGGLTADRAFSMKIKDVVLKSLWSWGYKPMLGLPGNFDRSSPVQVGALTDWASISIPGNHTNAIKNDGTLWAWGNNSNGYLGDGTTLQRSSPVQIGALTDWLKLGGGQFHSLAIKTDGSLWTWGGASSSFRKGQKGLGSIDNVSSPVQVGTLTDWASVTGGGRLHSLAIKTDGSLWAWGEGSDGKLGFNNTINRSSPVQVGNLTDWSSTGGGRAMSMAIKTDNTLWSWGQNSYGQLGHGTTVHKSSPVQIGNLTDWSQIAVGNNHTIATKADGTLWVWGGNNFGQLGLGNTNNRSSPVQVGGLADWSSCSCSVGTESISMAIKTDGTLWAWGRGSSGKLGLGDTINRSSPVQVGNDTNWSDVDPSLNHTGALKIES